MPSTIRVGILYKLFPQVPLNHRHCPKAHGNLFSASLDRAPFVFSHTESHSFYSMPALNPSPHLHNLPYTNSLSPLAGSAPYAKVLSIQMSALYLKPCEATFPGKEN